MRTYTVLVCNGHRYVNWPGDVVYSESRIRAVAVALFIEQFGRHPSFSWGDDGFMAEAGFKRGASVQIEQVNLDYALKSPCWTMHEGVPVPYIGPHKQLKEAA